MNEFKPPGVDGHESGSQIPIWEPIGGETLFRGGVEESRLNPGY